jgi:signal transduction protein with GAF and PtsI domain
MTTGGADTGTGVLSATILRDLMAAVNAALDAEQALDLVGRAAIDHLGDRDAASRPGAFKSGEVEHAVTAFFLITPSRDSMVLLAEEGWPADQHRLVIDIAEGRPGWVIRNRRSMVLPNTDDDGVFTQIIRTQRMGSSMYAPLMWKGEPLGLVSIAKQARHTFSSAYIPALEALASIAALAWVAHGGAALLHEFAAGPRLALDRALR